MSLAPKVSAPDAAGLPKITVVTPSYNQARYLEQSIRSVIDQSYPRLEYFVYDGGSTDGSVEIIRKHQHRLDFWVSGPDAGQSDAINRGFRRATGDVLCWINSDDYLGPGALQKVGEFFRSHPATGWLVGAAETLVDRQPPDMTRLPRRLTPEALMDWQSNWFAQQATFWRRSFFERVGPLDVSLQLLMDWDLWLRFYALQEPAILNTTLAGYRYHSAAKCVAAMESGSWPLRREELQVHAKILKSGSTDLLARYKGVAAERLLALATDYLRAAEGDVGGQRRSAQRDVFRALARRVTRAVRRSIPTRARARQRP